MEPAATRDGAAAGAGFVSPAGDGAPRLDVLKALGDNTRYAIYLEIARSPLPLGTAEIAEALGLHVNTVRPHLERMREVGLLEVEVAARGGVGRPQHRYSLAADAPALGLEPSPYPTLARVLLRAASTAGLDHDELAAAGREQGRRDADRWAPGTRCLDALEAEQARLGFDPAVVDGDDGAVVAFAHCPFQELAREHGDLVCGLHDGMVDGFVSGLGGRVVRFSPLHDRTPCQVELVDR